MIMAVRGLSTAKMKIDCPSALGWKSIGVRRSQRQMQFGGWGLHFRRAFPGFGVYKVLCEVAGRATIRSRICLTSFMTKRSTPTPAREGLLRRWLLRSAMKDRNHGVGKPGLIGIGCSGSAASGKPRTSLKVRSHLVRVKKCWPRSMA